MQALERSMAAKDPATHEHAQRVERRALALAREIGIIDVETLDAIATAALLHDVGKLGVPSHVLNKPGPLTADEYEQVKHHVIIGADILSAASFSSSVALFVRHHHENWDSTGYPDRLGGETIPAGARVLAIVDCFDALTSDRPYRPALSRARAVEMIQERRGTMYDPAITDVFLRLVRAEAAGADEPQWHREQAV